MSFFHHSVLLQEVIEAFSPLNLSYFLDCTLGAGGHTEAILRAHPEIVKSYGIDQDPDALAIAKERLHPFSSQIVPIKGNFLQAANHPDWPQFDGILMDLGVSSMQLDRPEKGFSFMKEGPLDMRMDPEGELTAAEIVNNWSEKEIAQVIWHYGEDTFSRVLAKAIVQARKTKPITTTKELVEVIESVKKRRKGKDIHPATLTFQALRIKVNAELEVLEQVLPKLVEMLNPGGRLAVISFHSLEDRIVKHCFRYLASDKENTSGVGGMFFDKKPEIKILTNRPIEPSEEESSQHPRSRSAKLRIVEKL